jgi:hypothetical protein
MDVQKIRQWFWFAVEAIIFIVIIMGLYRYMSNKLDISDQNLQAAYGTIEQVTMRNGELLSVRDSHIATINDLENKLNITTKEAKELQRNLNSKIAYISELESRVQVDSIVTVRDTVYVTVTDDSTKKMIASFHYDDHWLSLNGENEYTFGENYECKTILRNITMRTPLTVGLTNDYQIFVKSENPYVHFTSIDGAVIDKQKLRPRKQKFNWGLQFGVGAMYDVWHKQVAVGPYGGVGVAVNF